ncbi:MAG: TolC family protein, partial [Duncaniella sp.]|nr:TolC family protein [Duncaniella sp.]
LMAFRYRNMYQAGYWQYVSYKANRLPSLSLTATPARYYRYMTQRYDSEQNIDIFRQQQMFSASAGLEVTQNFDLLGGSLYLETDLEYMRNFGQNKYTQYSSVPVRIGYRQDLIGFNAFKWERKIEPLRYEKAKKELIYNMESVSEQAVSYFFALALAQAEYRLAEENVASCDTLYVIGERRFKIAAISRADLLTLELDKVNARNTLENCRIALKRASFSLASFLGMDKNTEIELKMPGRPLATAIPLDQALAMAKKNNPPLLGHRQTILEGEREFSRAKAESRFNASVNASVGFNQVADDFSGAYRSPLRQDLVSVSISVPLIDWGVRKGKVNMARNNLNVSRIAARQDELSVEEDLIMTVSDYEVRQRLIASASEALDLAETAYT